MRKHGVFFVSGLRPTGSRGFGCDRCRGQEEGAAKGEETGRADDHVRKEISFPSEKTEKAVYTISLVAQSARSEAGKRRQLFLMRWDFAGSNPRTQKEMGTPKAALRSKVLDPLSAIQQKAPYTKVCGAFLFQDCHCCQGWLVCGIVHKFMV